MKKSILIPAITAAVIASIGTSVYAISQNSTQKDTTTLIATTTSPVGTNATQNLSRKDETVYAIADASGAVSQTFIGNTLNTGSETLPINLNITYTLDGNEISARDLAGKSGRVTIKFSYETTATYQGKAVPFIALSGTILDQSKFKNVTIDHGRVLDDGSRITIISYAMPGLDVDLNTDLVPSSFTVTADVTNFELGSTYTLLTNEILQEFDTTKLTTVDDLVGSINDLSAGLDKIIAGSSDLSDGFKAILDGTAKLKDGATTLSTGINSAADGANKLKDGLDQIVSNNDALKAGATTVIKSTIAELAAENVNVTPENYETVIGGLLSTLGTNLETAQTAIASVPEGSDTYIELSTTITTRKAEIATLTKAYQLLKLNTGIIAYIEGVTEAATGATNLSSGLDTINAKTPELVSGLESLLDGETKLYNGSVTLKDGLTTFKTSGIDKLVDFANQDLSNFTYNARKTVDAAKSYTHFKNPTAESVKFIIKTASIK